MSCYPAYIRCTSIPIGFRDADQEGSDRYTIKSFSHTVSSPLITLSPRFSSIIRSTVRIYVNYSKAPIYSCEDCGEQFCESGNGDPAKPANTFKVPPACRTLKLILLYIVDKTSMRYCYYGKFGQAKNIIFINFFLRDPTVPRSTTSVIVPTCFFTFSHFQA
jgi:hypothetical protein